MLEPGLSAQPLSGFQGKQPVYIKFENGIVEIKDESLIEKMLAHRAFTHDNDFVVVEENAIDPFVGRREEMEPVHIHTEMKYGHVGASSMSPERKTKVNPEISKLVNDLAMKQIQDMLPGLVTQGVKDVLAAFKAENSVSSESTEDAQPKIKEVTPEDFTEEVAVSQEEIPAIDADIATDILKQAREEKKTPKATSKK